MTNSWKFVLKIIIAELLLPNNQLLQFVKSRPSSPLPITHFTQFGDSENSKVCYHIQ